MAARIKTVQNCSRRSFQLCEAVPKAHAAIVRNTGTKLMTSGSKKGVVKCMNFVESESILKQTVGKG